MPTLELPRPLKLGSRGRDVRALQRGLRRAGFRAKSSRATGRFDAQTDAEVRAFQRARGLGVDGEVGTLTFAALLPHYDPFARWLVRQVAKRLEKLQPKGARQRIVAAADVGYRSRDRIHYTQNGSPAHGPARMEGVREKIRLPNFPKYEDCSSFATWCYWVAGAPDPNGLGYNGFGYTGTQTQHGVEVRTPRAGDLVFYGGTRSVPGHVAVYVGNGRVVSHGSEPGPYLLNVDYRPINHIRSYLP